MSIGNLNKIIEIYNLSKEEDGRGGIKRSYTDKVGEFWASIHPLNGKERVYLNTQFKDVDTKIYMRANREVSNNSIVKWNDKVFSVKAVIEPAYRRDKMVLICSESKELGVQ